MHVRDFERLYDDGSGPKRVIPRGHLLQRAVIHGVHHRGQVAVLLRALGHTGRGRRALYDIGRSTVASR